MDSNQNKNKDEITNARRCGQCHKLTEDWVLWEGHYYCFGACINDAKSIAEKKKRPEIRYEPEIADFGDVAQRMIDRARQRTERVNAFAATQPQSKICERHHFTRTIDFDRSVTLTADDGLVVLKYKPCPKCQKEQSIVNQSGWLKTSGVPTLILHSTFDNFITRTEGDKTNLDNAKKFADKKRGMLVMMGDIGTGKSSLAVAIMRAIGSGWFVTQAVLISGLRRSYNDRRAPDVKERAKRARVLVLDEIGLSAEGSDVMPTIHEILDYRHGEKIPTIITSSPPGPANVEQLKEYIGIRMEDRIRQSNFKILKFAGESLRASKREEYFA